MTVSTSEQQESLEKSTVVIKQQIQLMRKCLDVKDKKNRLMDALKHASTFLSELRTNVLSPKQYYELYILAFDGLSYLSDYLKDTHLNNHLADLYELVQYAGNIIPRLYLMITVGTVYISIPGAPIREVLKDLMDMARGVQHPIRGLFLRYYMNQRTKDLLPTEFVGESGDDNNKDNNDGAGAGAGDNSSKGSLEDSIQFIITNFIEMNKLWVRLQHQGHSSERMKRLQERKELQILVGTNLVRLSQLEHIDKLYYKEHILPVALEQIIQCRDVLVQEYLLDVIIQVFPDEFQFATLDEFLDATLQLHPNVQIDKIFNTWVKRLINFKERDPSITADLENLQISIEKDLFNKVWKYVQNLDEQHPDIPLAEFSNILNSVIKLSITYYPTNFDYLDQVYAYAIGKAEQSQSQNQDADKQVQDNWKQLLLSPISGFTKLVDLLAIENYHKFLSLQQQTLQKDISIEIIDKLLTINSKITTEDETSKILQLLQFVIKGDSNKKGQSKKNANKSLLFGSTSLSDSQSLASSSATATATEKSSTDPNNTDLPIQQEKLAKILHLLYNKDQFVNFKLYEKAKQYLSKGGIKIKYTYPTLVQLCLKLIRKLQLLQKIDSEDNESVLQVSSIFKFISQCIQELYGTGGTGDASVLSFNLNLLGAQMADQVKLSDIANEFFIQSFVIYEESIIDSRLQIQCILSIIGKLHQVHNMISVSPDSYDNLITKTALYASRLLKKIDQCRGVYLASHLWWLVEEEDSDVIQPIKKDNKRVLECLQKSLRIADSCLDNAVSLELFVEILNRCLYYFIHGNDVINVQYVNGLIELIQNNIKEIKYERSQADANNERDNSNDNDDDHDNKRNVDNDDDDDDDDDVDDQDEERNDDELIKAERHFERTLKYIDVQKTIDERFEGIKV